LNNLIFMIAFLVALIIIAPFVTIWSLNTLFGLGLEFNVATVGAVLWLQMITFGSGAFSSATRNSK